MMDRQLGLRLGAGVATIALALAGTDARPITAMAADLTVKQVGVIEAPRVFHPGEDDKAGFWEDFGLTESFDFHPATQTLVAVLKAVNKAPNLFVFDLATGAVKFRKPITTDTRMNIRGMKLSPDGKLAAVPTGRGKQISIWNVGNATRVALAQVDGEAEDVDWHPSGQSVAVVAGKGIEVWRLSGATLQKERTIRGSRVETEWPMTARWSPDGTVLAIGTNSPAVYIAAADGSRQSASLAPMPKGSTYLAEWSPSGDRLASAGFGTGGEIGIWEQPKTALDSPFEKKYKLLHTFTPPASQGFRKLTWDPSGQLVAFGDAQSNVGIWDAATGKQMATFVAHAKSTVIEAHWKGDRLITVGAFPDKNFRIWSVTKSPTGDH